MKPVAAVASLVGNPYETEMLQSLKSCEVIDQTALAVSANIPSAPTGAGSVIVIPSVWDKSAVVAILKWFLKTQADHLLWLLPGAPLIGASGLRRLHLFASDTNAPLVYSDFFDRNVDGTVSYHPLIDCQAGSLRDDFDFGTALMMSRRALTGLADDIERSPIQILRGGLYDLRLRLMESGPLCRLPEPTYLMPKLDGQLSSGKMFDYVDPKNRDYQKEMEVVATESLKRMRAFLDPPSAHLVPDDASYPLKASIIIPVKNRVRTIGDAVKSALSQNASCDFNVIVIDNHSTDGTTPLLAQLARQERRLVHLVPERRDLGIGGCWNAAIYSRSCGRFAVQLDSDDLYSGPHVLERVVSELGRAPYAMVIGSYTTVDFNLKVLPPGLVDHHEWTDENGHNNALRVSGFGAPRAFHVPTLRTIGFPNVSYGEDYAVALQLSRKYRIGRIFDSLYWCRRWEGNSDSSLSLEQSNRYAVYKDRIRTAELIARQGGRSQ